MTSMLDHVDYLSKEIGARPAGTEEEQQAALYIAEQFQKEASFPATIEEFTSSSNLEGADAILAVVTFVVTVLALIFDVLTLPAFILATIAAVIYSLEAFNKPILSKVLARGASQNVIAKYQPFAQDAQSKRGRTRKIVLVAHYDTGKVTPPLVQTVKSTGLPFGLISVGGMIAAAVLLFVRMVTGLHEGFGGIFLTVLTVLALIVILMPIVKAVLIHLAPYNEGANNNASGVAAIIEVARRISRGSVSEADLAAAGEDVTIHGEEAAYESGLVPEGAQIRYEAEQLKPPEEFGAHDAEERLLSAKAAIAALTGQPVERKVYGSVAENLVNSRAHAHEETEHAGAEAEAQPAADEQAAETAAPLAGNEQAAASEETPTADPVSKPVKTVFGEVKPFAAPAPRPESPAPSTTGGFENAPSWFVAAQQNAKKPTGETGPIQRSRYTEAIENAEREMAQREAERLEEERRIAEEERKAREEAARAAIEAAQASARGDLADELEEKPAAEAEEAPAAEAAAQEAKQLDPSSTVAYAPISMDELRAQVASQDEETEPESSIIAPPEEFSMPSHRFELPKIEDKGEVAENTSPSRSGLFRRLRTDVPSLSGVLRLQAAGEDVSQKPEPVKEEPVVELPDPFAPSDEAAKAADAVDYDMPVSVPEEPAPEYGTGYAAEPEFSEIPARPHTRPTTRKMSTSRRSARSAEAGDVEMPTTRAGGFFSRLLGKNQEPLEETPQEWLDVDEDFDARTVGRERGGWESFRDDQYEDDYGEYDDDFDDYGSRGRWNGGSFSRVRLGHVDMHSGEDSSADVQEVIPDSPEDQDIVEDIEKIYHFRNPLFNTEVWFVALGSDTDLHDGARAFANEHREELRGSMIIEVESLGVGDLSVVSEEGRYRKVKTSSRVKRYMRQATNATGISPSSVSLVGTDSATTVLQREGLQTMHLMGVENGQPALKGSADDVLENIDEMILDENVNFLLELVKRG